MENTILIIGLALCITWLLSMWYLLKLTSAGRLGTALVEVIIVHGQRQGLNYLIGACLVMGACLVAFYDNFYNVDKTVWIALGWWQLIGLLCKALSAAPAALVGFLLRSPLSGQAATVVTVNPKPLTSPPFPVANPGEAAKTTP